MKLVVLLLSVVFSVRAYDLDQFSEYVSNQIEETKSYQSSTNNEKLFNVTDPKTYEYGSYDFIIVGAGAAGSVLAHRLTEIKSWNVLLLEAGGETTDFSDIPYFSQNLETSEMNWGYLSKPQTTCCQGMENHQCVVTRGKVIGGSTTINVAIYARGSPSDFDEWKAMGNPGWSYKDVLPYFKKSERVCFQSYDQDYHGTTGPLYVNQTYPPSVISDAFVRANLEKGLKEVDYNGKEQIGISRVQFNQKDNIHQNAAHAFLDSIRTRPNLKIVLNAAVNKILFAGKTAKGVTFVRNGKVYRANAKKEVILSAGAVNTPQLLMLSGVGPKKHLHDVGIPVIHNLAAVGDNLQDHPFFINLYFRTNMSAPNNTLKENLALYFEGKTPLTNGASAENLVFMNVDSINRGAADIEFIAVSPPLKVLPKTTFNFQEKNANVYKNYNLLTDFGIFLSLMKPKSRGSVRLTTNNIRDFPTIDLNYFSDPKGEDIETMYKGIKFILSLQETDAFKSINATLISEQPNCEQLKGNDKEYWYCALRHMTSTEYHLSGTTKMGPSEADSVVNKDGIVHGLNNLRIVDAGILPEITRGHLTATIYMIAEKISDEIKERYNMKSFDHNI